MATTTAQCVYFSEVGRTEIREEAVPDPGAGQVQVQSVANGICMFEVSIFNGNEPSYLKRRVGHEGVGVVTRLGPAVTGFKEGDYVACSNWATVQNHDCNIARLSAPPADPATFLIEPAACIVTAAYSYDINPGDRVLVLGAGFMGLLNVQALAHYPLRELVVADVKPYNLELARAYGATSTIDSGSEDGQVQLAALREEPFDLVVECAGVAATLEQAGPLTRAGGRLAIFAWHHAPRTVNFGLWHMRGLKVLNCAPNIGRDRSTDSMQRAVWLLERGIFDASRLVTHRHAFGDVQNAMEEAAARRDGYIKGVLEFR
jgi:threonine dehydrogenase-like Zn-dependent dehydrogenase